MKCPSCGSEAQPKHKHCIECGALLAPSLLSPNAESVLSGLRDQLKGMRDSLETISFPAASAELVKAAQAAQEAAGPSAPERSGEEVERLDYRLVVVSGRRAGAVFDVGRIITLGRGANCEVQLNDIAASREHCRIVFHPQRRVFLLQDLGSQNGTTLNGKRTSRAELANGDRLGVGDAVMVFVRGEVPDNLRTDLESRGLAIQRAEHGSAAPTADPDGAQEAPEPRPAGPATDRPAAVDPDLLQAESLDRQDTAPDFAEPFPAKHTTRAGFAVPPAPAGAPAGWPTTEELPAAVAGPASEEAAVGGAAPRHESNAPQRAAEEEEAVWTSAPAGGGASIPPPPQQARAAAQPPGDDATLQQIDLPAELLAAVVGASEGDALGRGDDDGAAFADEADEELLAALAAADTTLAVPAPAAHVAAAPTGRSKTEPDDVLDEQETLQFEAAVYGRRTPTGDQPTELLPAQPRSVHEEATEQLSAVDLGALDALGDLEDLSTRPFTPPQPTEGAAQRAAVAPTPQPVPLDEPPAFVAPDLFEMSAGGRLSPGRAASQSSQPSDPDVLALATPVDPVQDAPTNPRQGTPIVERRSASPGSAAHPLGRRG